MNIYMINKEDIKKIDIFDKLLNKYYNIESK